MLISDSEGRAALTLCLFLDTEEGAGRVDFTASEDGSLRGRQGAVEVELTPTVPAESFAGVTVRLRSRIGLRSSPAPLPPSGTRRVPPT